MLADAHYAASTEIQDREGRAAYWRKPQVWADIRFSFDRFFKLYPEAIAWRQNYAYYAFLCGQWGEFEKEIKSFTWTNLALFGGAERFDGMVQAAEARLKGK